MRCDPCGHICTGYSDTELTYGILLGFHFNLSSAPFYQTSHASSFNFVNVDLERVQLRVSVPSEAHRARAPTVY